MLAVIYRLAVCTITLSRCSLLPPRSASSATPLWLHETMPTTIPDDSASSPPSVVLLGTASCPSIHHQQAVTASSLDFQAHIPHADEVPRVDMDVVSVVLAGRALCPPPIPYAWQVARHYPP